MKSAANLLHPSGIIYNLIYILAIVFFTYFYTAVIFNPVDVAENLKKNGGYIPGIRPGKSTSEYLDAVLVRMLDVVKEMVVAESLQLHKRGKIDTSTNDYFAIVDGKTASLFRWAMFAGARAGGVERRGLRGARRVRQEARRGVPNRRRRARRRGDPEATGKTLLADLGEGKMTYPLLCALERCPELFPLVESASRGGEIGPDVASRVASTLRASGVVDDCLALARRLCEEAVHGLRPLPDGIAKRALVAIAAATPRAQEVTP